MKQSQFYEKFWEDESHRNAYSLDSAKREKFPAILKVWGKRRFPVEVMDFGCGNGVLTFMLKSHGFGEQIVGVDISKRAIGQARKQFSEPGLRFEHIDYLNATSSKHYDVMIASHVLEHIENPHETFWQLRSRAKLFVLEVPLERCLWQDCVAALRSGQRAANSAGHVNHWSRRSFRHFIDEVGLDVVADYQYASAPFSPYTSTIKRSVERCLLASIGLKLYGVCMATHYVVLARKKSTSK